MKHLHSPTMDEDDPELPISPRKKLKLEEPPLDAKMLDTFTKALAAPEFTPRDHTATANNPPHTPATLVTAKSPSPSQESTAATQIAVPPVVMPQPELEDLHHQSEAPGVSLHKMAANALKAQSSITDVADTLDDSYGKEAACGITEFVSPDLPGFSGILKKRSAHSIVAMYVSNVHRYTDFLVNEILPSGEVVHLSNLKAPSKTPRNTGLPENVGETSSANTTEQKVEVPETTTEQLKMEKQTSPLPDTSNPKHPTPNVKENVSPAKALEGIPQSMQDFDKYDSPPASPNVKEEKISPHKRIPRPAPSIPLSMQELDGKQLEPTQEKATRRKEKLHIRQTSQGWVEFDKEKEDEMKKRKADEDAAAGVQPEDETKMAGTEPEESTNVPEPQEVDSEQVPTAGSEASWQAFASSAPSSSFQVSSQAARPDTLLTLIQLRPEDKNTLLSYFSSDIVDEILALYDRIVDSPHRKARDYGIVTSGVIDRQKRTTIHQDIRRIFDSRLETMTNNDGAMMISAMVEKPTFHARTPMNASMRNNERGNHRGNMRGNDRVNNRGNGDRSRVPGARSKPNWEDLGGRYLHFSLYKENKDTMEAISWLSKQLKMYPKSFQFAGTKDRRAVTVQRVSVERVFVNPLLSAGRTLRNAHIGNFEYRPHPLQLGELDGNEFVITLRDCNFHYHAPIESKVILEGAQAIVGEAVRNLSERGFINYYGLQRFGSFAIGTEAVGLKMLQGDFQGAVDAILDYSPASLAAAQNSVSGNTDMVSMDDRARAHALHSFRTTNRPGQALNELPRKYSAESAIIRHLTGRSEHREDYLGAIQTIPRNLRLMYVHAYQSLVWNVAASERWKRFGSSVIEGDLVLVKDHTDKIEGVVKSEDVDADGEAIVLPGIDDRAINPDDIFERARVLTKDEAESGKYDIFDIVLPTPGYDIEYPSNEIGKFYDEFMASERGGGLDPHDMRRQWKDISLSGSYRKIIARPGKDFSFEIKAYKNEDEQFVETDMDRLRAGSQSQKPGSTPREHANQNAAARSTDDTNKEGAPTQDPSSSITKHDSNDRPTGNDTANPLRPIPSQESEDMEQGGVSLVGGAYRDYKIAVILKFQLGSSQYATMALRELMKAGGLKTYKADFSGGR